MISDTWKIATIEGGLVLVGILVALFVDSWREDQEFQELVLATEQYVAEEIRSNRNRLDNYRTDFQAREERLQVWGANLDTEQGILYQLDEFPGIPSTFLNQSAWSMANNSQITEYLNHDFYDSAFELYANGEKLEDRLDIALAVMFDVQGYDPNLTVAFLEVFKLYFDDIIQNIASLISDHDQFITEF